MVKNAIMALLVIGGFVLLGCSTADVEKANSIEDIVGTWQRVGGSTEDHCRYSADGTSYCADSLIHLNDRIEGFAGEYWFEGTQFFDKGCLEDGVYEILLLESGNIKFELIEDNCSRRAQSYVGAFSTEGKIEWEPAP